MNSRNISPFIISTLIINILLVCLCSQRQEVNAAPPSPSAAVKPFRQIDAVEFLRIMKDTPGVQVVDVRPSSYRDMVYLKGSAHIPIETLESRAGEIDISRPVIVYCQTGRKSAEAVRILSTKNPVELMELRGGISQLFAFLASEPENISGSADMAPLYDRLRGMIVTGAAVVGLPMPEVSFIDVEGRNISTGAIDGKPTLFAFFDVSDKKQIETISALRKAYSQKIKGLNFIPVAVAKNMESQKSLKKIADENKWPGVVYLDVRGKAAGALGVAGLPSFSLIDSGGVIRMHNVTHTEGPVDSCHDRTLEEMAILVSSGKLPPYPMSDAELSEIRQMKLVGAAAPAFSLPDAKGTQYSLSSYNAGGGVLLIFGTLRCPFTVRELIAANSCGSSASKGGEYNVIAVLPGNSFQEANEILQFVADQKINYPLLMDSSGEIFKKYSISSVPVWWVIGSDGVIRHREMGFTEATCTTVAKALGK